jgi:hypothetical protein
MFVEHRAKGGKSCFYSYFEPLPFVFILIITFAKAKAKGIKIRTFAPRGPQAPAGGGSGQKE